MATLADAAPVESVQRQLQDQFREDVLRGLSQERKAIPARWFYDHRGSELFEEITALPEYYPTRAEIEILTGHGDDIGAWTGAGRALIDFGAGSTAKTPLVIDCVDPSSYVPIDISGDFLRESCAALAERYPDMPILPVEADFTRPVAIPDEVGDVERLGFFPGSTIGNMAPYAAVDLLRAMRTTLGDASLLLIGMDKVKDRDVLTAAYDDSAGVTAEFNLNLLRRINRELGGTVPMDAMRHRAVWNASRSRIEMHLEAARDLSFEVDGQDFSMRAGETIHTENSHKYDERSATLLLLAGGWEPIETYTDRNARFMVILAKASSRRVTA